MWSAENTPRDTPKGLNESPSKKEGKCLINLDGRPHSCASMKAPPRRKGNALTSSKSSTASSCLNESPSKKEGKSQNPPPQPPAKKTPQ